MNHLLGAYSSLLIPGAVALVLLFLVFKVVNAIAKLVSLALLIAILAGGYLAYGRLSGIQKAVDAATQQGQTQYKSAAALAHAVGDPARQALAQTGLNPAYLRVHIVCAGPATQVQLRYADDSFMFGVLSQQWIDVPLNNNVRC